MNNATKDPEIKIEHPPIPAHCNMFRKEGDWVLYIPFPDGKGSLGIIVSKPFASRSLVSMVATCAWQDELERILVNAENDNKHLIERVQEARKNIQAWRSWGTSK